MNKTNWSKLKQKGLGDELKQPDRKLHTYGSQVVYVWLASAINVIGMFEMEVSFGVREINAIFHVIDCEGNILLGKDTTTKLGVLHITADVNAVGQDIFKEFSDCCRGVGKLKNFQLHLYIDDSVQPVGTISS